MDRPRGWRRAALLVRTAPAQVRPAVPEIARLTVAALAAYLVALPLVGGQDARPVLAPLTAMLVVQTTVYATLATALQRVVAVVAGVLVAVGVASLVGFTWWSLTIVVSASFVIARVLRLEGSEIEVPISAMLVLAVGSAPESAATGRIVETIIGAFVGIVVGLMIGSPLRIGSASDEIAAISEGMSALLRRMADDLRGGATYAKAERWSSDARALATRLPAARKLLDEAEDSLRLNPRAAETLRTGWSLRPRVEALVAAVLSLVPLSRALTERILREPEQEDVYTVDVRRALVRWLEEIADVADAFGRVAASPVAPSPIAGARLSETLATARAMRPRVADLLLVDARGDPEAWDTHGALLLNADRLLDDLDVDRYAAVREAWLAEREPDEPGEPAQAGDVAVPEPAPAPRRWSDLLPRFLRRRRSPSQPPAPPVRSR